MSLPESVDQLVRDLTQEGESYSSALTRLVEAGARAMAQGRAPRYVGAFDGPGDVSSRTDEVLREIFAKWRD